MIFEVNIHFLKLYISNNVLILNCWTDNVKTDFKHNYNCLIVIMQKNFILS